MSDEITPDQKEQVITEIRKIQSLFWTIAETTRVIQNECYDKHTSGANKTGGEAMTLAGDFLLSSVVAMAESAYDAVESLEKILGLDERPLFTEKSIRISSDGLKLEEYERVD